MQWAQKWTALRPTSSASTRASVTWTWKPTAGSHPPGLAYAQITLLDLASALQPGDFAEIQLQQSQRCCKLAHTASSLL